MPNRPLGLTLDAALRYNAEHFGAVDALVQDDRSVTYADLDRLVTGFAITLRSRGIERGDRVLVMLENSLEHLVIMWGIQRAGCALVACSTAYTPDEVGYQLADAAPRAVVTSADRVELFTSLAARDGADIAVIVAAPATVSDLSAVPADPEWPEDPPRADELAFIVYTSGTTSRPKGVMLSHGFVYTVAQRGRDALAYQHGERTLHFFPMYHLLGATLILGPTVLVAGTLFVEPRFSASRFSRLLVEREITMTALNATHVKMLLLQPSTPFDRAHAVKRMQFALPIDAERRRTFEEAFGTRLVEIYGLTETGVVVASPVWSFHTSDALGLPLPGVDLAIMDESGQPVGTGVDGTIAVRADPLTTTTGYFGDPAATARLIRDGWLYTGDIGRLDDYGYVHFVDRAGYMIKRGGYNVAPAEVERVLLEHADVAEAAVVGIPDPIREEAIVAFVVPREGVAIGEEEITAFCAEWLASYKRPSFVAVVDKLPENFVGKVEKSTLREESLRRFGQALS